MSYRNFKNFDSTPFRADMGSQNWGILKDFNDPNDMWYAWKSTVKAVKASWITAQLKQRMHDRDIQKIKAIRSKSPIDWATFKKTS